MLVRMKCLLQKGGTFHMFAKNKKKPIQISLFVMVNEGEVQWVPGSFSEAEPSDIVTRGLLDISDVLTGAVLFLVDLAIP